VFTNLLENAADAMGWVGQVRILGAVRGKWVEVQVSDHRSRHPAELARNVFLNSITARVPRTRESSGLGLWWVKSWVTRFGGKVAIESASGHGTTFILSLPVSGGMCDGQDNLSTDAGFIVEDDSSWQQILTEILNDCDLEVDLAESYEEALKLIRASSHRIAVMDLSLGGTDHRNQDGLKYWMRSTGWTRTAISIFLTGFATVELAVSLIHELGAYTCLRKETFRRADFRRVINYA